MPLTTGGAIDDDARVVEIMVRKHYAQAWRGARITVRADGCSNRSTWPRHPSSADAESRPLQGVAI